MGALVALTVFLMILGGIAVLVALGFLIAWAAHPDRWRRHLLTALSVTLGCVVLVFFLSMLAGILLVLGDR